MRTIWCVLILCSAGFVKAQTPLNVQHTVQKGETLYKISRDYGMTVAEIRELNPNVSVIQPGLKLQVKKKLDIKPRKIVFTEHAVKKGETLYQISQRYQVKVSEIRDLNDLTDNSIAAGMILKIPGTGELKEIPKTNDSPANSKETAPSNKKNKDDSNEATTTVNAPVNNQNPNEMKGGIIEKNSGSNKTVYVSKTENKKVQLLDTTTMPGLDPSKSYVWMSGVLPNQVILLVNSQNQQMAYALSQPKIGQQSKDVIIVSPLTAKKLGVQNNTTELSIQYVVPKP